MYRVAALSLILASSTFLLPSCFDLEQSALAGPRPDNVAITVRGPDPSAPSVVDLQPKANVPDPDAGLSKEELEQRKRDSENGPCCEFSVDFRYRLAPDQFIEFVLVNFDALGTAEKIVLPIENRFREAAPDGTRTGSIQTRVPPQVAARGNFPFRVELVTGIGTRSDIIVGSITVR